MSIGCYAVLGFGAFFLLVDWAVRERGRERERMGLPRRAEHYE